MAVKDDLERIFQLFISREQPLAFFRGFAEYADFIFEKPQLKSIVDGQLSERRVLIRKIEDAEQQTLTEMQQAKQELVSLLKKRRLKVKELKRFQTHSFGKTTTILQELESFEKRKSFGSIFISDEIEKHLFDIAANLLGTGHKDDVEKYLASENQYSEYYGRINGPSQYIHTGNVHGAFIFSKTWPMRWELQRDFEREQKLKPWGAFEKIMRFRMAYELAQKTVDMRLLPEGGTENEVWFSAPKEGVEIASIARDIQRLVEGDHDFYSRVATNLETAGGRDFEEERWAEFKDVAQTVHGVLLREIEKVPLQEVSQTKTTRLPTVSYNPVSGYGYIGDRKFKFVDGTPEYRVFGKLYENINKKLGRYDVLEIGHFYEDGEEPNPTKKTLETAFINGVTKTMREKTGLSVEQIVQNRGNLTLVGIKSPTNEPQMHPK